MIEHHYRWMTPLPWNGKMTPTRYHCTEEEIRKVHPNAVRIEGTLIVRETGDRRLTPADTPLTPGPR